MVFIDRKQARARVSRLSRQQWSTLAAIDPIYVAVLYGHIVLQQPLPALSEHIGGKKDLPMYLQAALHLVGYRDQAATERAKLNADTPRAH